MTPLDRYDRAILQNLQQDGRITVARLAERVHLSESACARRLKALESSGIIAGYTVVIDQNRAGLPINVFVNVTLRQQDEADLTAFETAVRKVPEILECYLMTGDYDYSLRVAVADIEDLERLHHQVLTRLPCVARLHTSIAIRRVKRIQPLPPEAD